MLLGGWGRGGLLVRLSNKSQVRNLYVCTIGKGLELECVFTVSTRVYLGYFVSFMYIAYDINVHSSHDVTACF